MKSIRELETERERITSLIHKRKMIEQLVKEHIDKMEMAIHKGYRENSDCTVTLVLEINKDELRKLVEGL